MVTQDLGTQRHRVTSRDRAVRPSLQRQLIVVAGSADTGVFHAEIDLVDGAVNAVDGDHADHIGAQRLVVLRVHVATAVAQCDLHAQRGAHVQSRQMKLGVQDLHFTVALDVAGCHLAGAGGLDKDRLGALAVQLGQQILHVQNDLRHIFLHTGDGGKLVLHTGDLDAGGCRAGKGREQDAPQRIA